MWSPCCKVTDSLIVSLNRREQTCPSTAVGNEWHVLLALWGRKDIYTLRVGPWVCAVSALVPSLANTFCPMQTVWHPRCMYRQWWNTKNTITYSLKKLQNIVSHCQMKFYSNPIYLFLSHCTPCVDKMSSWKSPSLQISDCYSLLGYPMQTVRMLGS